MIHVATIRDGKLWAAESDLFGTPEYQGRIPRDGIMRAGRVYSLPQSSPTAPAPATKQRDDDPALSSRPAAP